MPSPLLLTTIILVALSAILYQTLLHPLIFHSLGYARAILPFPSFNISCVKIAVPGLEGCEDLWLHEPSGYLYLACSQTDGRVQWNPSIDKFNASGRSLKDSIYVLDTHAEGPWADRVQPVSTIGFDGNRGDGTMNLHGIDIRVLDEGRDGKAPTIQLALINHRPLQDASSGEYLDTAKLGQNSTIEIFETTLGEPSMVHKKTYKDDVIKTPNDLIFLDDGAFVFTNEKSAKTGFSRHIEAISGGGSVGYCDAEGCKVAAEGFFTAPNGITKGLDGLIYVGSSVTGEVQVLALQPDHSLVKIATLKMPFPVDNLTTDSNGDIFVAGFPHGHEFFTALKTPHEMVPATGVMRIRKQGQEYEIEKIFEDDGKTMRLPSITAAVHDPRKGKLWVAGCITPYQAVCDVK